MKSFTLASGVLSPAFFFSSRRRHTRFDCDWSSDVCSSDLYTVTLAGGSTPPPPGGELVTNGGFESGTSGWTFANFSSVTTGDAQAGTSKAQRSEERRVGKECRSRGAPEHQKQTGRRRQGSS